MDDSSYMNAHLLFLYICFPLSFVSERGFGAFGQSVLSFREVRSK